jgi:hypothetical protein
MSLCVVCGYSTLDSNDICTHHTASYAADWAIGNRLMCDLLHRGIVSTPASRRIGTRRTVARDESTSEVAA